MSRQKNISITGQDDLTWHPVQVRLGDLDGWEGNPKRLTKAQAQRLLKSTRKLGQLQTIAVSPPKPDGRRDIYDGHQRNSVWQKAYHPDLVVWAMESSRFLTEQERKDVAMLTMTARGSFDWDILSGWDDLTEYLDAFLLSELKVDLVALEEFFKSEQYTGVNRSDKTPFSRKLPLDFIFTFSSPPRCCLATSFGLLYGIQSGSSVCRYADTPGHKLDFIDNDYFRYDHSLHLRYIKEYRPKYATTRDIMTEEQCLAAGIPYYPLEQILEWAEEISEYAENVIVIPKYDCIQQIPEKFVLGYSIPTSHGATYLPVDLFRGRRVHLLGGNFDLQLAYLKALGEDVISIDNNHQNLVSKYGYYYDKNLRGFRNVTELLGYSPVGHYFVSLALSFGAIATVLSEIYPLQNQPSSEEFNDDLERIPSR